MYSFAVCPSLDLLDCYPYLHSPGEKPSLADPSPPLCVCCRSFQSITCVCEKHANAQAPVLYADPVVTISSVSY